MRKGILVIFLLLIFVILGSILFFPKFYSEENPVLNALAVKDNSDDGGDSIPRVDIGQTDQGQEGDQSNQGDQGSQGGCSNQQISYAVKNLKVEQECLDFEEGCVNKNVDCSFEVYNLDYKISGDFGFNLHLVETGQGGEKIDSVYLESVIRPRENVTLDNIFNVLGPSANKNLTCIYEKEMVPKKEVCT